MSESLIHTRREFLHKGLALLSASATVPFFIDRTAWAISDPLDVRNTRSRAGSDDDRILVVVQLAGGNDGLNTLVPFENDLYYKARPRLGIARKDVLRLTDVLGLHPAASGLKQLYDDGLLAIIQGVGYPNPDRSHFVSTDIWSTADPDGRRHDGWIGRYFDCTCSGRPGAAVPDPRLGIAITQETPLAMQGERFNPVSFETPDELTWRGGQRSRTAKEAFEKLNAPNGTKAPQPDQPLDETGALAFLQRTAMDARASAATIQRAAGGGVGRRRDDLVGGGGGRRGGALAGQLAMVKRMIAAGLKTRVYYVSMGGFDTHAGQPGRHQQLLTQLGDALADFTTTLKDDGLLDKVLVMTFSEFGRRVGENASQGTDHGAAAPMFIIGNGVKPGLHGKHPSLEPSQLDRGDLKWQVDFRSVYSSVLSGWLRADSKRILGGSFKPMPLLT